MIARSWTLGATVAALTLLAACKTAEEPNDAAAADGAAATTTNTGTSTSTGSTGTGTGTGTSIPTLVNVNLQNVLNDLSVSLNVNRNNIPVNAQVPIDVAANVCGVSVSALAASIGSGNAGCTAKTSSPQLVQAIQQQISTGGNVGGGPQTQGAPTNNMM
jgi:hypothetical protein